MLNFLSDLMSIMIILQIIFALNKLKQKNMYARFTGRQQNNYQNFTSYHQIVTRRNKRELNNITNCGKV